MASLSFGVSHLNTVERLKIRSGSSAAYAGATTRPANSSKKKQPNRLEHRNSLSPFHGAYCAAANTG